MLNKRTGDINGIRKPASGLFQVVFLFLMFFGLAIVWGFHSYEFQKSAEKSEGVVIKMVPSSSGSGSATYSPEVRYTDGDGVSEIFRSSFASYPPAHEVGDVVEVLYLLDDSEKPRINSFGELWFFPMIMGGVSGVLFLVLMFMLWFRLKKRKLKADPYANYQSSLKEDAAGVLELSSLAPPKNIAKDGVFGLVHQQVALSKAQSTFSAQSRFDIHLLAAGNQKIALIKIIREITKLGLREAKNLVDFPGGLIKASVPRDEAFGFKSMFELYGAKVDLIELNSES